ncbi:unnamed protein product [Sphacelaria rigidula]
MFIVPSCRGEPDGRKCRELYDLLLDFITNRTIVLPTLCADLPGLSSSSGSCGVDVDAPLPEPASADEEAEASSAAAAGRGLFEAVVADSSSGNKQNYDQEGETAAVVPILVWLMRLIVQPRVTASDSHLSGLLSLARVLIRRLGPRGRQEVGLRGLLSIPVGGGGDAVDIAVGRKMGLLYYVYYDCLFEIATSENHGPLAPPKCRWVVID